MVAKKPSTKSHARQVLDKAISVLEQSYEVALQNKDLDAMINISDRLMMLYQHLSDNSQIKFKTGFALVDEDKGEVHGGQED